MRGPPATTQPAPPYPANAVCMAGSPGPPNGSSPAPTPRTGWHRSGDTNRQNPDPNTNGLLIAPGADVKTVQARLRHASARTTLDTYGLIWPTATRPPGPRLTRRSPPIARSTGGTPLPRPARRCRSAGRYRRRSSANRSPGRLTCATAEVVVFQSGKHGLPGRSFPGFRQLFSLAPGNVMVKSHTRGRAWGACPAPGHTGAAGTLRSPTPLYRNPARILTRS